MTNQKSLSNTLIELINIKSYPFQEKELSSFLLNKIQSMGYRCYEDHSKEKTGSNTGNIIVDLTQNSGQKIVFCSHMDTIHLEFPPTVSVSEEVIESIGNTAIGIDNKAGISIMLEILKHYKDHQDLLRNVIFIFTTCEEECFYGAKQVESKLLENAFIYVLDSGGSSIGDVVNSGAGQASFYISIFGEASHISGYTGVNAILLASKFISSLPLGLNKEDITLNVSKMKGGLTTNVVPDHVEIKGEITWSNLNSLQDMLLRIKNQLEDTIRKNNGQYSFNHVIDCHPFKKPIDSEIIEYTKKAYENIGKSLSFAKTQGGSDAQVFNDRGFNAVKLKIGMQNVHCKNEKIDIKDLASAFEHTQSIIEYRIKKELQS